MNDRQNKDIAEDEQLLDDILRHAEPRPRPGDAARERAFAELHAEWKDMTAARRRQRRNFLTGVAATLLAAILVGTQWNAQPPAAVLSVDIMRASGGSVTYNGRVHDSAQLIADSVSFQSGDELTTSAGTRLALAWGNGSLRLDEGTSIRIDKAGSLTLRDGSLYFDSMPYGDEANAPGQILIDTPIGEVSHAGTQFQVAVDDDAVTVKVREGEVRIAGQRVDIGVFEGESVALTNSGQFEKNRVDPHDDSWRWAADIAPEIELRGRTTAEVFEWIARETGYELRFASQAARDLANSEPRGIGALAPLPALRTIPYMTSLKYSMHDGQIVIDIASEDDR